MLLSKSGVPTCKDAIRYDRGSDVPQAVSDMDAKCKDL